MSAENLSPITQLALSINRPAALAALFAPPAVCHALCALIGFQHEIAKTARVVSDPMLGEIRLQWWADAIGQIYSDADQAPRHEVIQPLAMAISDFHLAQSDFMDAIAAERRALYAPEPADTAALISILTEFEAPILRLKLAVTGHDSPAIIQQASTVLGVARWCQSLPQDRADRRLLMPLADMEKHGLDLVKIIDFTPGPAFDDLVADVASLGLHAFRKLKAEHPPRACLPAILPVVAAKRRLTLLVKKRQPVLSGALSLPDPLLPLVYAWARLIGL